MKTRLLLALAAFTVCTAQQANAKIWRVNNNGYSADFAQLQDANDANNVVSGDTIHLEGSAITYNDATITKKLIIIGSGYFLPYNPGTAFSKLSTTIFNITFSNGSQGSQLIGVHLTGGSGVIIKTSNIAVKRCQINSSVILTNNISNIVITQNFFLRNSSTAINAGGTNFPTDFVFNNNICQQPLVVNDPNYIFLECNNNIFDVPTVSPAVQIYASSFQNNILTNPNATAIINNGDITNVDYNISASANNQFGNSKKNIIVTDTSTLFAGGTSPDGRYQLKTNSPAKANGSDGTDRGVFGGGAPQKWYTLSGLAPIPVVYDISSTGVGSTGLPVIIKARTIK